MKHRNSRVFQVVAMFFWAGILSFSTLSANDPANCAYCSKPITEGKWVEIDGRSYHAEHFLCARCDRPIDVAMHYKVEGQYYDSNCYLEHIAPRCNYCRRPISEEWVSNDSGTFHPSCYYDHVAPRCIVCKQPISGQYFFDEFGMTVCAEHREDVLQCFACSRMISDRPGEQGKQYPDGRQICSYCLKYAVTDIRAVKQLMAEVTKDLGREGIDVDADVELRLVDRRELARLSQEFVEDRMGITIYEKAGLIPGLWTLRDFKIRVLDGLPRELLRSVLAHELMHVWLFKNAPAELDRQLCEGSCEYAAFLVLSRNQSDDSRFYADRLMENPDPVYGEGFRNVKAMVGKVGKSAWLQYLKENSSPPWGHTSR